MFDPTDKQLKLLFDNKKKSKVQELLQTVKVPEEEVQPFFADLHMGGFYDDFGNLTNALLLRRRR